MAERITETDGFIQVEVGKNSPDAERGDLITVKGVISPPYVITRSAHNNSDPLTVGVLSYNPAMDDYTLDNIHEISVGTHVLVKKFHSIKDNKLKIGVYTALKLLKG